MKVQEHQLGTVVRNWRFREVHYCIFSRRICIFMLIYSIDKSLLTIRSEDSLLNRLWNNNKWTLSFRTKSFSAIRLTLIFTAWLIVKIVAFGIQTIYGWLLRLKHIHNISLFCADFGLDSSSDHSSFKMRTFMHYHLIVFAITTW